MNRREATRRGGHRAGRGRRRAAEGRPHQSQGRPQDHQARNLPRPAALAVPQGPHRRRHRRPRRADRRGPGARPSPTAVKEIEPYLVGKDPRQVVHHWQAIYRHAFYRGGPVLTSALSGIDMALWDIKGKALGVPVYELLGGPTRTQGPRLRPRPHAGRDQARASPQGFTAFKTGPPVPPPHPRYVETPAAGRATPSSSSPSCARPPATTSTSASTSTARSARRWPSC